MFLFKKRMNRRTVLRGLGASVALPWLDAMVPALGATTPTKRFGAVYVPNGIAMHNWTPSSDSIGLEFKPILQPLAAFREQVVLLTGLNSIPPPWSRDTHPRASTRFLTGVPPKATRGLAELEAGISMDQIAANALGQSSRLASLELALESSESAGACSSGFSCAYTSTISWSGASTPLPMEHNPRAVFERLFGDSGTTDPQLRRLRLRENGSLLDSVNQKRAELTREIGVTDRTQLDAYFDAVRDVERRIQITEATTLELPVMTVPAGIPDEFEEHARLMYDLFALAYQIDATRVITFMIGRESSGRTFPQFGIPDAHHPLSHHQNDPVKLAKLTTINQFHISLFAEFLETLRTTPDGDGSLLDHVVLMYGSGMSDGNTHDPMNLPLLLAGGGCGTVKGGRNIRFANDTPLANLHLTLLDKLNVQHDETLFDGTGILGEI
jgi:hypothetical protein